MTGRRVKAFDAGLQQEQSDPYRMTKREGYRMGEVLIRVRWVYGKGYHLLFRMDRINGIEKCRRMNRKREIKRMR